jgi:antitoxin StbD
MATTTILTKDTIGVSEFKRNPLKALREAVEEQVAVLSHNRPIGYFVAPAVFAQMHDALEQLEDLQDALLSEQRWQEQKERIIDVDVEELGKL